MNFACLRRFWSKVKINPLAEGLCWEWIGAINSGGYGLFGYNSNIVRAHRFMYYLKHPNFNIICKDHKTDQLDHTCKNRSCVNPAHLERVTNRENTARGKSSKLKATKTSKYTGVSWDEGRKQWRAQAYIDGKDKFLGRFNSEFEAHKAYKKILNPD